MTTTTAGSVLIVDDDEETALLLRDILRRRGFAVEATSSGREALEHLQSTPADVVVTDVQMPGMSGIELCRELIRLNADQLAIVVTGRAGAGVASAATAAGAFEFLVKPVAPDLLVLTIGRALVELSVRRAQRRADLERKSLDA